MNILWAVVNYLIKFEQSKGNFMSIFALNMCLSEFYLLNYYVYLSLHYIYVFIMLCIREIRF
jgi:hypothetical protein